MIKKEKIVITIVLVVSCITATPVAAKNVENNTYQICRNDIFIDWYQLNCKKIISETPLYNFFIKKYRTGLSDV